MIVWADSTAGANVVNTNTQPARYSVSAFGVPVLWRLRHCCRARPACSALKR
jgi:hypothetical protein